MSLRIAIIGTGNVAYHLAVRLNSIDCPPIAIFSRSRSNGLSFIAQLCLKSELLTEKSIPPCEFVILAVPDSAIPEVISQFHFHSETIVLHTSGSQSLELLSSHSNHGVLYPLQTFSTEKNIDFSQVPILIEANNSVTLKRVRILAEMLSPRVSEMDSAKRMRVHLAAVFACNFTNHLFGLAESCLSDTEIKLSDLKHLMQETLDKALVIGSKKAQTGPAKRGDHEIIQKHLALLDRDEDSKAVYELITNQISRQQ